MKKIFKDAIEDAKKIPKGLWVAALVVPGGLATITAYIAGKGIYVSMKRKKEEK